MDGRRLAPAGVTLSQTKGLLAQEEARHSKHTHTHTNTCESPDGENENIERGVHHGNRSSHRGIKDQS